MQLNKSKVREAVARHGFSTVLKSLRAELAFVETLKKASRRVKKLKGILKKSGTKSNKSKSTKCKRVHWKTPLVQKTSY